MGNFFRKIRQLGDYCLFFAFHKKNIAKKMRFAYHGKTLFLWFRYLKGFFPLHLFTKIFNISFRAFPINLATIIFIYAFILKSFERGYRERTFQKFSPCNFATSIRKTLAAAAVTTVLADVAAFLESHFRTAFRAGRILQVLIFICEYWGFIF